MNSFELSIISKFNVESICLPLIGDPSILPILKRRGIALGGANEKKSDHLIAKSSLADEDSLPDEGILEFLLRDSYEPNSANFISGLKTWFTEQEATWLSNIRERIEKIENPAIRDLAAALAIKTAEVALARRLRAPELSQSMSKIFRQISENFVPFPRSSLRTTLKIAKPGEFVGDFPAHLMFLRLPEPAFDSQNVKEDWREVWISQGRSSIESLSNRDFTDLFTKTPGKQYILNSIEEILSRCGNFQHWMISFVDVPFISAQNLTELVSRFRKVSAVYAKDISDLTGKRAAILVASF
ncbi:MAG TPA: hypothetical protein VNK26_04850 [Pyrinomonadaceae bacterium]|nr:hypothetical protein [Pyrinomonadaceae bacterium]